MSVWVLCILLTALLVAVVAINEELIPKKETPTTADRVAYVAALLVIGGVIVTLGFLAR